MASSSAKFKLENRLLLAVLAIASCWPLNASAALRWTTPPGRYPQLEARSDEPESDASFRARCRNLDKIDLRVGAAEQVGNGKGENVRLRMKSGHHVARLRGVSERSIDYEMTLGTELVTRVKSRDPVFIVLRTGSPIQLSGSVERPTTWGVRGARGAVVRFLTACRRRPG
ncbi:hypothetical protein M446_1475 [Methylobacterium sp. 4-46]|nr:hypothetical protein M446_1475 [Methylobacterium sp. 4-46]